MMESNNPNWQNLPAHHLAFLEDREGKIDVFVQYGYSLTKRKCLGDQILVQAFRIRASAADVQESSDVGPSGLQIIRHSLSKQYAICRYAWRARIRA